MSAEEWFLLLLRVAHALAAMVWLGGGVYYLLAIRPAARAADDPPNAFIATVQRGFGEWAPVLTLVMLVSGGVLSFDRLASDGEGLTYALLLAAKILAAVIAFWLAGVRPARRAVRRRGARRAAPELLVALGLFAFALGVALSSVYGRSTT